MSNLPRTPSGVLHDKLPFGFITAEQLSPRVGLTVERIIELAESGYMPHHRFDGEGPFFKRTEAAAWVKENLATATAGMPLPRTFPVIATRPTPAFVGDVPPEIQALDSLIEFPDLPSFPCAIYFLCKNRRVVYVGQSRALLARICTHRTQKDFDRVFFLPCPQGELDRIEGSFIRALKPELNGHGPSVTSEDVDRVRALLGEAVPA